MAHHPAFVRWRTRRAGRFLQKDVVRTGDAAQSVPLGFRKVRARSCLYNRKILLHSKECLSVLSFTKLQDNEYRLRQGPQAQEEALKKISRTVRSHSYFG